MKEHSKEYGINESQIMVGGESAGAGLCIALKMMARDKGEVEIAFQMPLYPMIDNFDTDSSKDNHGKIWNTKRNHFAWKKYLRKDVANDVSPYAAPARQKIILIYRQHTLLWLMENHFFRKLLHILII